MYSSLTHFVVNIEAIIYSNLKQGPTRNGGNKQANENEIVTNESCK